MQIWGSYKFLVIFWSILDNRNGNLGKKYVKRGFYLSRVKLQQLPLIFMEK